MSDSCKYYVLLLPEQTVFIVSLTLSVCKVLPILIKVCLPFSADEYLSFAFQRCNISSSKNKR